MENHGKLLIMLICDSCGKGTRIIAFSRHKKGSSGAGGNWALRAPIHKRLQKVNLHKYHGMSLCSKCLKTVKKVMLAKPTVVTPNQNPQLQPLNP